MKDIPIIHKANAKARSNFNIRSMSEILKGKDFKRDLHRHDFFVIFCFKKGNGFQEIDFKEYSIQKNSLFLLRPGQIHKLRIDAKSEGFLIQFGQNFFRPLKSHLYKTLRLQENKDFYVFDNNEYDGINYLAECIYQEHKDKKAGYVESIKAYFELLFIHLFRKISLDKFPSNQSTSYYQEKLEVLLFTIELKLGEMKQVNEYAEYLNQTPYQLNKITKITLGKTFSEVIADNILLEAKRYTLGTSNQIKEIAYHLGYDDVSYFIRFFKKHIGHTPEEFRQLHTSKIDSRL
ncbi:AraC family transcriptional regulator [Winogradskyella endarachnes]|uniref:Helix-turn-helix domain-containing protein n=1 Tax=Winogradskyella endarachnes TaxID=2681965 RepID=A0A6L6UAT1_9FLAO|nr:AraC family transcriptional regulator [Winogradskyella endarachnes]MUU78646.1 helix-turn-helix domain-containing protein [Winogradskyella endarachnes]